jgi:hypothetical protein
MKGTEVCMSDYSAALAVRWRGDLRVDPTELQRAIRDGWLADGVQGWDTEVVGPGRVLFRPKGNLVTNSGINTSLAATFGLTGDSAYHTINAIGVDNGTGNPVPNTNMSASLNVTGCSLTSGSANGTTTDTADLAGVAVGMGVSGSGVPSGTTITAVNASAGTFTMSANASASGSGLTLTFATSTARTIIAMSPAASRSGQQISCGGTFTNSNVAFAMQRLFLNAGTTDAAGNLYAMTAVFTINMTSFSSWSQAFTPTISGVGS